MGHLPRSRVKIVAWNLGHQTVERPIKGGVLEAVRKLAPDVLTLNEYVHGESRKSFLEGLSKVGLVHVLVSERVGTHNQVLIACRHPLKHGPLRGPASENGAAESNFLHVLIPDAGIEVVGMRVPSYEGRKLKAYWTGLQETVRGARGRSILFIGDLNTDPEATQRPTSGYLRALREEGWTVTAPSGAWSFVGGTRIDHAIASPTVTLLSAQYVAELGKLQLSSRNSVTRLSDHAALVVELRSNIK